MLHRLASLTRSPARGLATATLGAGLATAILGFAATLGGCSDGMQVGSVHVKSGTVGPGGGSLVVTSADALQLAGTSIVFPPGALARDTFVAIGFSDASLALDDARPEGPALYFEPVGLDLAHAASVTVPYDKEIDSRRVLVRALAGTEVRDVTPRITHIDSDAALVTFELDRLGHTQPQAIPLFPDVDAGCNAVNCNEIDAGCFLGACPGSDAGVDIDAGNGNSCPLFCPIGTMCNPATNQCSAICNNMICPQGQGCNPNNQCVNQCGMGGAITFLCPPNQVCDFATGTCHP